MSTWSGPSQVMIVRHGEKLGDAGSDKDGGPDLSVRGSSRAAALPSLFVPQTPQQMSCLVAPPGVGDPPLPQFFTGTYVEVTVGGGTAPRFPTPQWIFATATSSNSDRPIETITPTSRALDLPVNASFGNSSSDITMMANQILGDQMYSGQIVLICWHHGTIPAVAEALGVPADQVPNWKSTDFDRLWLIAWDAQGTATLTDDTQQLLYGDKSS